MQIPIRKIILLSFDKILFPPESAALRHIAGAQINAVCFISHAVPNTIFHLYQNKLKLVVNSRCSVMTQQCQFSLFIEPAALK